MKRPFAAVAALAASFSISIPAVLFTALIGVAGAAQAAGVTGDATAGQHKAAQCYGCHGIEGYQASFPDVYKVPKIAGQNAKYIVSALTAYAKGDRRHPTMRSVAGAMSEQDMADLGAYFEQLGKGAPAPDALPTPPAEVAALLQKGACTSCHGPNLSKPIDPSYPKLAGQYSDYVYEALRAYSNPAPLATFGRNNAIMGGQAKQFSHAELKVLANYIGSLPGEIKTVAEPRFK